MDLLNYKLQLRSYLIDVYLEKVQIPTMIKTEIRRVTSSLELFRASCGYSFAMQYKPVDLAWRGGWPAAGELCLNLFEAPQMTDDSSLVTCHNFETPPTPDVPTTSCPVLPLVPSQSPPCRNKPQTFH